PVRLLNGNACCTVKQEPVSGFVCLTTMLFVMKQRRRTIFFNRKTDDARDKFNTIPESPGRTGLDTSGYTGKHT
ncbi:MAG: hypothetical protein RSC68_19415, partial [Acinetobacter sp.]